MMISNLQEERLKYRPVLPLFLNQDFDKIFVDYGNATSSVRDTEKVAKLFPSTFGQKTIKFNDKKGSKLNTSALKIGVILSGGQAPGGHNVIAGLFYAMKKANSKSELYGFLGGPDGLVDGNYKLLTKDIIDSYFNTGGFDMIASGRGKLTTEEQFKKCESVCKKIGINAVVIIGGDDSNTNAATLAEYFAHNKSGISVIGCPKTIDGDLKNSEIETSFGFDTATKVYGELVGNIMKDVLSAKKYWHFIRLMGRSASHIALECALRTQPNICLIGEEIKSKNMSLMQIANDIADIVIKRAENNKNYGVVLVPEGLVEFVPEVEKLLSEINSLLGKNPNLDAKGIESSLTPNSKKCFVSLPSDIKAQLLAERDPHGNVQVSRIETEKLLSLMVADIVSKKKIKFSPLCHFFGYEGRSAYPSNFDSSYCYALGYNAFMLVASGATGYLSSIKNLTKPSSQWVFMGSPITGMFCIETRGGKEVPVIQKALVELNGKVFKYFEKNRNNWKLEDEYLSPGAIQYFGPEKVCNLVTKTLELESN